MTKTADITNPKDNESNHRIEEPQQRYNAKTGAAMEEARRIANGTIPTKRYASAPEMMDDIL